MPQPANINENWTFENGAWWYHWSNETVHRRTRGVIVHCEHCGADMVLIPSRTRGRKFCSKRCSGLASTPFKELKGFKHHAWKGGRIITKSGYVMLHIPDHPYARAGKYVAEHRVVMERILGRYLLPNEIVHHKNGDKTDNRPENLEVWVRGHPPGTRIEDGQKHCPTCTCFLHQPNRPASVN